MHKGQIPVATRAVTPPEGFASLRIDPVTFALIAKFSNDEELPVGGGGEVTAEKVTVTNIGYETQQEINDMLLYVPLRVTGFTTNLGVQLIGSLLNDIRLSWSYSKGIQTQSVDGISVEKSVRFKDYIGIELTETQSFGLSANDGSGKPGAQSGAGTTVYFSNKRFWGVGAPGLTNINLLQNSDLPAGETRSIVINQTAGANQKIYYARPARLGAGAYVIGGFEGGVIERTVMYINEAGFPENYIIGETANTNLGNTTIIVN